MNEIIIYGAAGTTIKVENNLFVDRRAKPLTELNSGLRQYDPDISQLHSLANSDQFGKIQSQPVFVIKTHSEEVSEILKFLSSQDQFIETAYLKMEAETP